MCVFDAILTFTLGLKTEREFLEGKAKVKLSNIMNIFKSHCDDCCLNEMVENFNILSS